MAYPEWRRFVNDTHAQRFAELLESIEVVSFRKMDEQIWDYLVKRAQATGSNLLKVTHQEIAGELVSSREVITRLLDQLQRQGRVVLGRGTVEVNVSGVRRPLSEEGGKGGS